MKIQIPIILLAIHLAACKPSQAIPVDAQNTAMVAVQTYIALTQTAQPTGTPTFVTVTPSPIPTLPPPPLITPDAVQVERWKEYQSALAEKFIPVSFPIELVLCEWDILGQTEQELYVWAVCVAPGYEAMRPAVIYLGGDGSIQKVEAPIYGSKWDSDIRMMFPEDVREKIYSEDFFQRSMELKKHIEWRQTHLGEPPLIIVSVSPSATPLP